MDIYLLLNPQPLPKYKPGRRSQIVGESKELTIK